MINAFRSLFKRHKLSHIASAIRARGFDPFKELFGNGQQGVYYDPSDIITMFLDSAGTTPVAPVGTVADQPVGRILDKSGRGIHATQPTSTARPLLSARVNLLTKTEDFADAVWALLNSLTKTPNSVLAPDGTLTACRLYGPAINGALYGHGLITANACNSCWLKSNTGSNYTVLLGPMPLTVTPAWQHFSATKSVYDYMWKMTLSAAGTDVAIWHPQYEIAASATPYQRVNTASDYDAVGFPHFLKFDGIDDSLSTGSINFTSTDKMSVFAGTLINTLSTQMLNEFGAGGGAESGSYYVAVDAVTGGTGYNAVSHGSALLAANQGAKSSPTAVGVRNVVTALFNISGDLSIVRKNAAAGVNGIGDQGTGNFANKALNIGARNNGASLFFNGHIYSLIVRGAQSTDAEITSTEKFIAGKTGVTLP
jgi:hypothetical protein